MTAEDAEEDGAEDFPAEWFTDNIEEVAEEPEQAGPTDSLTRICLTLRDRGVELGDGCLSALRSASKTDALEVLEALHGLIISGDKTTTAAPSRFVETALSSRAAQELNALCAALQKDGIVLDDSTITTLRGTHKCIALAALRSLKDRVMTVDQVGVDASSFVKNAIAQASCKEVLAEADGTQEEAPRGAGEEADEQDWEAIFDEVEAEQALTKGRKKRKRRRGEDAAADLEVLEACSRSLSQQYDVLIKDVKDLERTVISLRDRGVQLDTEALQLLRSVDRQAAMAVLDDLSDRADLLADHSSHVKSLLKTKAGVLCNPALFKLRFGQAVHKENQKGKGKGKGKAESQGPGPRPAGCTTLCIRNIAYDVTEDELWSAFEDLAIPTTIRLLTDRETGESRGVAFAEFDDELLVEEAIQLNNMELKGRKLRVDWARQLGGKGSKTGASKKAKGSEDAEAAPPWRR